MLGLIRLLQIDVRVCLTEHSFLELLLRPARHVFVQREPLRGMSLAFAIVKDFPRGHTWSVLETGVDFS